MKKQILAMGGGPSYHRLISDGMKPGIACDDGVAAHFIDGKLIDFVSSRKNTNAFRVGIKNGQIKEERISPRFLG